MKQINATIKGVITGAVIITILYIAFNAKVKSDSFIYLIYLLYAAGILWTLIDYRRSGLHDNKFKEFFNQGFRCFIVVTLFMVIHTFIFYKVHIDELAVQFKVSLQELKDKTPADIETDVNNFRKNYPIFQAGFALFQYLVIGALISGIASAFFSQKRNEIA